MLPVVIHAPKLLHFLIVFKFLGRLNPLKIILNNYWHNFIPNYFLINIAPEE